MNRFLALALVAASLALGACQSTPPPRYQEQPGDRLVMLQVKLGLGYMQEGQYELAMQRLAKARELGPDVPDVHDALGILHARLGQPARAEESFRRAIELSPDFAAARNHFGGFLCAQGRPEEGEQQLLAAAENPLYKRREVAYTNAGLCLMRHGEPERAEGYLRDALGIDPKMPAALLGMARLTFNSGRHLPARAYLQRYAEVGPKTPESLWLGYRVERELGDRSAATAYAVALRANFPDSRQVQLLDEAIAP